MNGIKTTARAWRDLTVEGGVGKPHRVHPQKHPLWQRPQVQQPTWRQRCFKGQELAPLLLNLRA